MLTSPYLPPSMHSARHTGLLKTHPLYSRKKGFYKWTHAVIPAIASAIYIFVLYATIITTTISLPVIVGVVVMALYFVITAYLSWRRPVIPRLEEGEEL